MRVRHHPITEDQSATGVKPERADEIIKQGIIESISVRHVGRLLEEAGVHLNECECVTKELK